MPVYLDDSPDIVVDIADLRRRLSILENNQSIAPPNTVLGGASSGTRPSGSPGSIPDGSIAYVKLAPDVPTTLDVRYVNVTGDTMTGGLTVNAPVTVGNGGAPQSIYVTGTITGTTSGTFGAVLVTNGAIQNTTSNAGMELGLVGSSNNPYIDFHSGAFSTDYDGRIRASGGTAADGAGTLTYTTGTHAFVGAVTASSTATVSGASTLSGTVTIGSWANVATDLGVGAASLRASLGYGNLGVRSTATSVPTVIFQAVSLQSGDIFQTLDAAGTTPTFRISPAGLVTGPGTLNLTGTGANSVGGNFTSTLGVFAKNKGLFVADLNHGLTADSGGYTYLLNAIGTGTNAAKAAYFHLTDGASDIGRIHSTAISILGGGYSGATWTATDIGTNTIYGVGQGTGSAQVNGANNGNLALYTVGTDNIVDGALTSSKLSLPSVAAVIASGAGNNTTNSFFRFVYTGNSYVDPATSAQLSGLVPQNGASVVSDPQAYQSYAIKIPSSSGGGSTHTTGPGITLPNGIYNITVFLRAGVNTSSSNIATFATSTSSGTATISGSPAVIANTLSTTGYMGYTFSITLAGGVTGLNVQVLGNFIDVYVSHITGMPAAATVTPYLSTIFTPNIFATSATISSVSATSLVAGTISTDDIFMGSGGHIYLGPTTHGTATGVQQRLELNSGGLYAYDGTKQTLRVGADGSITLTGNITASTGTITGANIVATSAAGGTLTVSGLTTDNKMTLDTSNGLRVIAEGATNLFTGPSFEAGNTPGSSNAVTATIDKTKAFVGAQCLKLVSNGGTDCYAEYYMTLTVGTTYAFSAYVMHPSGSYTQGGNGGGLFIYNSGAGAAATTITAPCTQWTRQKVIFTPTVASTVIRLYAPNASGTAWWDAIQVETQAGATASTVRFTRYCDGDQLGCSWSGTAHASTSTRTTSQVITQLGINDNDIFSGTIIAGNIFGSTIAGSKFVSYGQNSRLLQFDANGINQYNDAGTKTFYTDSDGNITATAGRIAGFTISGNNLTGTPSTSIIQGGTLIGVFNTSTAGNRVTIDTSTGTPVGYIRFYTGSAFESLSGSLYQSEQGTGSTAVNAMTLTAGSHTNEYSPGFTLQGSYNADNSTSAGYSSNVIKNVRSMYLLGAMDVAYRLNVGGVNPDVGVVTVGNNITTMKQTGWGVELTPSGVANTTATWRGMRWNSLTNAGSDFGYVVFQDSSAWVQGGNTTGESSRFTIGTMNDSGNNTSVSDELWLQGSARLVMNAGRQDSEMDAILGVNGAHNSGIAFEWRIDNVGKGYMDVNALVYNGIIQAGYSGAQGTSLITTGGSGNTGYVAFLSPNGTRSGYIGFGAAITSGSDTGRVSYVAGGHDFFNGNVVVNGNNLYANNVVGQHVLGTTGATYGFLTYAASAGSYSSDANANDCVLRSENGVLRIGSNSSGVSATITLDSTNAIMYLKPGAQLRLNNKIMLADTSSTASRLNSDHVNGNHTRVGAVSGCFVYLARDDGSAYVQVFGGAYTNASSIKTKKDVEDLPKTGALAAVKKLRHVAYTNKEGGTRIGRGLIAEEVKKVAPEVIQMMAVEGGPDIMGIEQQGLTSLALHGVQELAAEVEALRAELEALKHP